MKSQMLYKLGLLSLALSAGVPLAFSDTPAMFGANIAGGEFANTSTHPYPGTLNGNYWYPRQDDIDMAKAIGVELVRVPFKWDRIQHDTEGVLDAGLWMPDINALDASINAMEARGMRIILDMHNYASRSFTVGGTTTSYVLGSPQLPISEFARVWRLLADHYKDRPSIWGYDLMNEPGPVWVDVEQRISMSTLIAAYQAAVNAIREVDTKHAIILEGRGSNHSSSWLTGGAPLFAAGTGVVDPMNNLVASAHCYTDKDQDGGWNNGGTVQAELVSSGKYPDLASAYECGVDRVKPFVDWCVANNIRGLVGEYTLPGITDTANWDIVSERLMAYMRDHGNGLISGTQWSSGGLSQNQQRMQPRVDYSKPPSQKTFLPDYFSGIGTAYWTRFVWFGGSGDTLQGTGGTNYSYVYPTSPDITFSISDTSAFYSGTKSAHFHWTLPAGNNAGGGMHTGGPNVAGGIGGIDLSAAIISGHVLSFYAMGTPGAAVSVTLASTSDANDVDTQVTGGATITQTGSYVSLGSISPLNSTWQRYEIPLSSFLNSSLNGSRHVQRLLFTVGPSDGTARDVYIDSITVATPSTNTAPAVTVDTSTGGTAFTTGQNFTMVATASDANPGDSIDYVEFFANHAKVGIDDASPYQYTTSLAIGGTYDLTAVAYDSHGVPMQSAVKTITVTDPATVPPAAPPTNLVATSGNTEVTLRWFGVSDATYYNIKRATVSGGPYVTVGSTAGIIYTDTGLVNGTTYYYVVSAANAAGQSANSASVSVAPVPPPAPPAVLSATVGDQRVALSWTSSSTALTYTVKRATVSGGPYTELDMVATTSFSDFGVANGTTYYYVVSATNNSGESANSVQLAVTPSASTIIIKDNSDATGVVKTGSWTSSTSSPSANYYPPNYWHDSNTGTTGGKKVVFTPTIPAAGNYDVYGRWPASSGRATNAPFDIKYSGGAVATLSLNQADTGNNGLWVYLGTYAFDAGTVGNVTIRNDGANGFVMADAVEFVAAPLSTVITLGNLTATYNGTPKAVTATTSPAGLGVSLTYNGSATAPTNAGTYPVVATVTSAGYVGNSATGTLVIQKAPATVTLGNLSQSYDGTAKTATVTTAPASLPVSVTYNGSATAPSAVGSYTVVATVTDPNYSGSATGTLTIASATEVIVDNTAAEYTGTWNLSSFQANSYLGNYRTRASGGTGSKKMRWRPTIATAGIYQVYYWLPNGSADRPTNAPFTVFYNGGSQTYLVSQQPAVGGQWILLGSHTFAAGTAGYVELTDNANGTNMVGDAIRFYKP